MMVMSRLLRSRHIVVVAVVAGSADFAGQGAIDACSVTFGTWSANRPLFVAKRPSTIEAHKLRLSPPTISCDASGISRFTTVSEHALHWKL